jgi:non-specific serine/threonine protein kinase
VPGNLPRQATSFVGREAEITSLLELVGQAPVVTLTGVGGVGKTRLALRVGAEAVAQFGHGAWLCEFAPLTDRGAVWETVAATLGVRPLAGRGVEESVLAYLATKRLLVVLDNCEHLLGPIAGLVEAITQRAPGVAVLATSREGLGIAGERLVAVGSLPVPAEDMPLDAVRGADAVRLFCDRATAAKHDFVLGDADAAAAGVLCRRLDGIPLAIELAAARVRSLSPEDLVARLDQRFRLLTRGSRAGLERHQTLRSAIDWSYDLLEPHERDALARLSVFAGGCDLAAAEAVLADDALEVLDVVDLLGQLVDKSLVVADSASPGMRYRLLETIRQYAQERLEASGQTEAIRRRHADHYVELAETAGPHLESRDQLVWAQTVAGEMDNFRAVLDWAIEVPSPDHALRLVIPLAGTTLAIGETAGEWAETACSIPGVEAHPLFPAAAGMAAVNATQRRDFRRADARLADAERAGSSLNPPDLALLGPRAFLAFHRGDFEPACQHASDFLDVARASGDPNLIAQGLLLYAMAVRSIEPDVAIATQEEAIRVARDAEILSALSNGLMILAAYVRVEEPERALALFDEAIEVGTRVGDRHGVAAAILGKGEIALARGDYHAALRATADAAEQKLQAGYLVELLPCFDVAARALCALNCFEPAAVLIAKSDAIDATEYDASLWYRQDPVWQPESISLTRDALVDALGEEHFAVLSARGGALGLAEAVDYLRAEADRVAPDTTVSSIPAALDAAPSAECVFRRDGELWILAYDGAQVQLRDAKGLGYLARLLAQPGREIHVAELAAEHTGGEQAPRSQPAGEALDAAATRAYRERLVELEVEFAEATEWRDPERAARAEAEIDALTEQLAGAYGLGGRARTLGDPGERVRKAVTNRIKASLNRIAAAHASLGRHLANAIHTGTFCSYTPDGPLTWQLGDSARAEHGDNLIVLTRPPDL